MSKNKTEKIFRAVFLLIAIFYAAILVRLVFIRDGIRLEEETSHFLPLGALREYKAGFKTLKSVVLNYVGNIAIFFPLGIFLPVIFKKLNFLKVILTGFLISLFIETVQYLLSAGYTDIDDVIMNTLGAAIGAFVYFYILGGKRKNTVSYVLSLSVVLFTVFGGMVCIWRYAPHLLPDNAVEINGMIAGRRLDSYDVYAKCKGMSKGEVAVKKETATGKDGGKIENIPRTYFISDTAVFVAAEEKNGGKTYHIIGLDEMIEKAMAEERPYLKLWLNKENKCEMIMVE